MTHINLCLKLLCRLSTKSAKTIRYWYSSDTNASYCYNIDVAVAAAAANDDDVQKQV